MIKVAIAQINPTVGDLPGNAVKIIDYIRKARQKKAGIVIFPELALAGYPPEDLLLKNHFISKNKTFLNRIKKECRDMVVLVGFVEGRLDSIYNSCAIIQNKRITGIYRKIMLPNYGVFDEKRYFIPGDTLYLCDFKDKRFALTICEDVWEKGVYSRLKDQGIDFIVNISASPFHLGKMAQREKILSKAARYVKSSILYCNLVGGQDEILFDGTSKVISKEGKLIACAKRFQEDLLIFNFPSKNKPLKKIKPNQVEEAFNALCLGLKDYVRKNNFKKVVVGVSGGIDSAIVVALAKIALGSKNVYGVIMPSVFTSKETLRDAKKICKNLNIKQHVVGIESIFTAYKSKFKSYFEGRKEDKTEENLQARIRGNILMAFSNKFGYLVLNTGNKSEVSCGYCTLYGDMVGGFGVLKDVNKKMVYKLGYYINKISKKNIIPLSIMKRAPSAELKPGQKDIDNLPPYDILDPILKLYIEDNYSCEEIIAKGFGESVVKKVIKMVDNNEYKRRQGPIGIKITPRAFGKDRRMPITNRFSE